MTVFRRAKRQMLKAKIKVFSLSAGEGELGSRSGSRKVIHGEVEWVRVPFFFFPTVVDFH